MSFLTGRYEGMPMRSLLRPSLVLLMMVACTPRVHGGRETDARTCVGHDTIRAVVVADTEEDFWPDSVTRTEARMANLQYRIARYERETGRVPDSLAEFLPPDAWRIRADRDAWGNPIQFRRLADEYELRAPGPDGNAGTADDIVASRDTVLPRPKPDPPRTTRTNLGLLQALVTAYERRTGSLPERLADLPAAGMQPDPWLADGWGQAIRYTRRGSEFELRSAGPDGVFETSDDLAADERVPIAIPDCEQRDDA